MKIIRKLWRYHIRKKDQRHVDKEVKKKYHLNKHKKNIIIFGTPNHGNLGDYAIGVAEKKLFSKYSPNSNIFDVSMAVFNREISSLKKFIQKHDLLILTGGGNLGNQYPDDEEIRRKVITLFPYNRIVIFPQTLYFTPDVLGEREKQITSTIYNQHNDLTIIARDNYSYEEMEKIFTCKIDLLADVVLTLPPMEKIEKSGALLVLRSDIEKNILDEDREKIITSLRKNDLEITITDTEIETDFNYNELEKSFRAKLAQFQVAQLVVTDRLHGIIFAAITNTPCIAISNYNHKINETYKWIKHLNYVTLLTSYNEIDENIRKYKNMKECVFSNRDIEIDYDRFIKSILLY